MKKYFQQIDIQRLAGINSILGVDLDDHRARIVELRRTGYSFNRFKVNFQPLSAFSFDFPSKKTWQEKGSILKEKLSEKGVKTQYCASSVQSLGVKVVQTIVPRRTQDINEWITENQEKLLRLPITSSQINHTYEILRESENGWHIEISFARSEDIQNQQILFQQAGLMLIHLGIGIRDVFNIIRLMRPSPNTIALRYVKGANVFSSIMQDGKRVELIRELELNSINQLNSSEDDIQKIICGTIADSNPESFYKPFELDSEYSLAAGLAIKGFLPDIHSQNLLLPEDKQHLENIVYKSLFHKTALAVGSILLGLLLLQTVLDHFISSRIESIESEFMAHGAAYTEVRVLEKQIKELENQTSGKGAAIRSSHLAPVLHDIAKSAPEGLWFYRLKEDANISSKYQISIFGYTIKEEKITEFLTTLSEIEVQVNLVRSGNPQQNESIIPTHGSKNFVTFELKLLGK